MKRIIKIGLVIFFLICLQACTTTPKPEVKDRSDRPNFIIIITDDQRADTMDYMPQTRKLIFDQRVNFPHAYATTPLCGPSRASILTGMYAHNTNVRDNTGKLTDRTFIEYLHDAGYFTGLVGKYLNSWKGEPRPEFDYWVSFFKGEVDFDTPRINVNGDWQKHPGYITDILGNYTRDFINESIEKDQPFALIYAPNAPHAPATPNERDMRFYTPPELWRPLSFNAQNAADKPQWMQKLGPMGEDQIKSIDQFREDQLLTLAPLDRNLANLIHQLQMTGELNHTFIVFLSDNGKFWGEHRLSSKNSYYEEAARIPFAIRYPPLTGLPHTEDKVVANIDIAPTIYELAGISIPEGVDGLSLVNLFQPDAPWRDGILIEGYPPRGIFSAYHTERYIYSETLNDCAEFYDLQSDPYEMTNLISIPDLKAEIDLLKSKLDLVKDQNPVSAEE